MKYIILALSLTCSIAWATPVVSPYVSIALGATGSPDRHFDAADGGTTYSGDFKDGGGGLLEGAVGLDLHQLPFRVEAALSVLIQGIDSIDWDGGPLQEVDEGALGVSAFMLNGYFDIPTGTLLEPYVFAGIGRASVFTQLDDEGVSDEVAAAQLGAGLGLVLTDYFIIDLKIRHFETSDYKLEEKQFRLESDIRSNQLIAGFRVRF